ncbi:hypothetical protein [Candidatus Nitrosocosmicus hydrocola]|uniref:hypothetical protein n=1 Tax=Candidatus Nitrosocosmicus hydrocola TaxID=1826872 RepID=UPI0011E5D6B9|nr:hypothetical protein [Candidatus Nitrosocosmicus hydrocola]
MKYIFTLFITVFLAHLIQIVNAQPTGNRFVDALDTMSNEIGESINNTTQTAPSIGDALNASSSISNTTSDQKKVVNSTTREMDQSIDTTPQDIPSIGDALTASSSISNYTNP